ncbi:MAG TPA: hypothetical protein VGM30_02880 [Puia sp.]|jgi:hypothetical protein
MEIKGGGRLWKILPGCMLLLLVFFFTGLAGRAQAPVHTYSVRDGQEYISLGVNIKKGTLDSFMKQYNLASIGLQQFFRTRRADSLQRLGWRHKRTGDLYIISRPLLSSGNIGNPAGQIILTEKHPTIQERFPAVNNGVLYGYNRFRHKYPFAIKDGVVTFFLKGNTRASHVQLAGSFNDWSTGSLAMSLTDSGWIANVRLSPGKYWYKFIADGEWMVDDDNWLSENDGLGNTNSVFYVTNTLFQLTGFTHAGKAFLSGSFNEWRPDELSMVRTGAGWGLSLYLAEGTHTYRFVVDGEWMADPANPNRLPNEYGEFNSVIRLGKPYVFELAGYTGARKVVLSGSFNNWRNDELFMRKTKSGWTLPYTLGPGNYEYRYLVDGKWVIDPKNPLVISDGNDKDGMKSSYLIIDPNYTFRLKGHSDAKRVILSGDFDNWSSNTLAMKREGNVWVFPVHLSIGKHLYKFIVDGEWITDPDNGLWEQNEKGTDNSVIWVDK